MYAGTMMLMSNEYFFTAKEGALTICEELKAKSMERRFEAKLAQNIAESKKLDQDQTQKKEGDEEPLISKGELRSTQAESKHSYAKEPHQEAQKEGSMTEGEIITPQGGDQANEILDPEDQAQNNAPEIAQQTG